MDSIKDLLGHKADNIDTTSVDEIALLQSELDKQFKGKVKVQMITDHDVLHLSVSESGLASELRMSQIQIMDAASTILERKVKNIRISIR